MGRSHAAVVQILGSPLVAILLLLFVLNTTYHMWIGMQEIVVDYVHHEFAKLALLMGNTFFCIVIGFACAYALLKLSFGV
jgi:succinate dehydrogenase / fumarate reductase membrane anchor subunit